CAVCVRKKKSRETAAQSRGRKRNDFEQCQYLLQWTIDKIKKQEGMIKELTQQNARMKRALSRRCPECGSDGEDHYVDVTCSPPSPKRSLLGRRPVSRNVMRMMSNLDSLFSSASKSSSAHHSIARAILVRPPPTKATVEVDPLDLNFQLQRTCDDYRTLWKESARSPIGHASRDTNIVKLEPQCDYTVDDTKLAANEAYRLLPSETEAKPPCLLSSSRQSRVNVVHDAGRDRRRRTPLSAMADTINGRELPSLDPDEVDRILENGVEGETDLRPTADEKP
ncbi:hypothetical protein AAVH_33088, partial [Aphelenchoides avenae]